ncbi:unnamed protein product [Caenorhabditis bovis]|uniref:Nucleotide exchange factor Fes1 domain-containing protein n=1 Tax=Caenorhabditis bovis TaxID=2654633 RepID=A0A8S1ER79_9PELO|nr:unnamed protein product [Caenorhabditis bovis]
MSDGVPAHYWKNLLAITTKAQAENPDNTPVAPMSAENKEWLEQVMKELVNETDPFKQLDGVLKGLHQYSSRIATVNGAEFDEILNLCDRLDELLAIADLSKMFLNNGGILILESMIFQTRNEEVRRSFAQVILTWAENNEVAQNGIVEAGFLEKLLNLLSKDEVKQPLASSLLSAISGTVRSNIAAFDKFRELKGPELFLKIVEEKNYVQVSAKAARVLTSISYTLQDSPAHAKALTKTILKVYGILVSYNQPLAELEYIREFILTYIEWNDLDEQERELLLLKLDEESRRDLDDTNSTMIANLQKKFAPLRTG